MSSSKHVCAGCNSEIDGEKGDLFVCCMKCVGIYDILCANLSTERYHAMKKEELESWICQTCKCNSRIYSRDKALATPKSSAQQSPCHIHASETMIATGNLISPLAAGLDTTVLDETVNQSSLSYGGMANVNMLRGSKMRTDLDWTYTEDTCGMDSIRAIIREEVESALESKVTEMLKKYTKPINEALDVLSNKIEEVGSVLKEYMVKEKLQKEISTKHRQNEESCPNVVLDVGTVNQNPANLDLSDRGSTVTVTPTETVFHPDTACIAAIMVADPNPVPEDSCSKILGPAVEVSNANGKAASKKESYAAKARINVNVKDTKKVDTSQTVDRSKMDNSRDGEEVAKRKRRTNFTEIRKGSNKKEVAIKGMELRKYLHVWRLLKSTTEKDMLEFVRNVCGNETDIKVDRVKTKTKRDYASFIIAVPESAYNDLCQSEIWPVHVEFSEWIWFRSAGNKDN